MDKILESLIESALSEIKTEIQRQVKELDDQVYLDVEDIRERILDLEERIYDR